MSDPSAHADAPDDAEGWIDALHEAFLNDEPGRLRLAEQAVKDCPADAEILNLAAVAALLEERPDRCLRFVKRLRKRFVPNNSDHLLEALALAQQGRRGAARQLLKKRGMDSFDSAWWWLPGGQSLRPWFREQIRGIRRQDRRTTVAARVPAIRSPRQGRSAQAVDAKTGPTAAAAPQAAEQAFPELPRFDPDIPVRFELLAPDRIRLEAPAPETEAGDPRIWFALRAELGHLGLMQGFDELLCLPLLRQVDTYWFQIETVRKVLKSFRGRVLLADEVGLGKTVEAGMVLKEYMLRGMVERLLILTPASLVGQWREEMETKFDIACATSHDPLLRRDPQRFWAQPRVIASIATARRKEHHTYLTAGAYDLVIVDEAHHLKNRATANYKLVDALRKRFLLLLSATPVQNSLVELYNLLTLLKPGIFKTEKEFKALYMTPRRPRVPANQERLRDLMRDVMIRNTRALVDVRLPPRHALTLRVDVGIDENSCYRRLGELIHAVHTDAPGRHRLALHHLLSAAGSSPATAAAAIRRFAQRHPGDPAWVGLAERYGAIASGAKEDALMELLARNPGEKKMVFVHHRETLSHLDWLLTDRGIRFARFDGALSGPDKDAAIVAFREQYPVLLCTESGGEGRNVQFCNTLINFDLPWNPMAIEQRIGRIHRIGQQREVFIFNLVSRGTVEDEVLRLLDEKINMFELVVGEIDAILGQLDEPHDFSELVFNAWVEASEEGRGAVFADLGRRMIEAKHRYQAVKELDDELFEDAFETT